MSDASFLLSWWEPEEFLASFKPQDRKSTDKGVRTKMGQSN